MNLYCYDIEVYKYDNLAVFKKYDKEEYVIIQNNPKALYDFLSTKDLVLAGFNNSAYDDYMLRAMVTFDNPLFVKELNDWIIGQQKKPKKERQLVWNAPLLSQTKYLNLKTFDLRKNMQLGLSLKEIEAHFGQDIYETPIDFNIDRKLTPEELTQVTEYCRNDVIQVEKLIKRRKVYLNTKMKIGRRMNYSIVKALSKTMKSLSEIYLKATEPVPNDWREISMPDTAYFNVLPKEIISFFSQPTNEKLSHDYIFDNEVNKKRLLKLGDMDITVSWGGVHGDIKSYVEESSKERAIIIIDVSSLYPSLMIEYDLISRAITDPQKYIDTKKERLYYKANHMKDDDLANKGIINTVYGASLEKTSKLYDEKNGRSVCVAGQMLLLSLTYKLYNEVSDMIPINLNTDGLMLSCPRSELEKVRSIYHQWEKDTRLELEEEVVTKIVQKDVNNYLMVKEAGGIELKGGFFKSGEQLSPTYSINNNINIVKKAIVDYFTKGTDPEITINNCNDPFEFQYIAKATSKYSGVIYEARPDTFVEVQKVNRVFASKDKTRGSIYKKHIEKYEKNKIMLEYVKEVYIDKRPNKFAVDGFEYRYETTTKSGKPTKKWWFFPLGDKVATIPKNCIIDNKMKITIDKIDKVWYTNLARKRIKSFAKEE